MQRNPIYPVANCNIKMPDAVQPDSAPEEDGDQQQRRLQLVNFGHSQWGFNNWSWSVTKQELDFVDLANGKYTAGVVAFVSITIKSLDIHRENIGYATSIGSNKGYAIFKSRKCAVTNALRETLLSFGGTVAAELNELLETFREHEPLHENNQNIPNQPVPVPPLDRPKNLPECANRQPPAMKNPCSHTAPTVATAMPMPMPSALAPPRSAPPPGRAPRSNEPEGVKSAEAGEEEARAERKRRQRQAQEEFRQKQLLLKGKGDKDDTEVHRNSSSFDRLLLEIPSQDIKIEHTGTPEDNKRKSPAPEGSSKKRVLNRLDIVQKK